MIDTSQRSNQKEWMDDLEMDDPILIPTLDTIANINRKLGGTKVTINGLKKLFQKNPAKEYSILDVGCGNGAMLRSIADYCSKKDIKVKLIGLDANPTTIAYAKQQSKDYKNIEFIKGNIFSEELNQIDFDIATATLFLHHFKDEELLKIVNNLYKNCRYGLIFNDLQRSKLAYICFKSIAIFVKSKMAKNDGAISILRSFKRKNLVQYSKELNLQTSIKWKWAFRYEWLIYKK